MTFIPRHPSAQPHPYVAASLAMAYDLVIFDNDGVLVNSEPLAVLTDIEMLRAEGLEMTEQEIVDGFLGRDFDALVEHAAARLGRPLGADFRERFHARLFERFEAELEPVPGVERVLEGLTVPYCVASSGSHARIRRSLALAGLLEHFEGRIFSVDDVGRGKPHPDLFLHAASVLGADARACVVIEDSPAGIEAAHAAGMTVLGFAALTPAERLAGADAVFADMSELPDLLVPAATLAARTPIGKEEVDAADDRGRAGGGSRRTSLRRDGR